jgi:5-formyltetrahydrofolate cyclo-ligase
MDPTELRRNMNRQRRALPARVTRQAGRAVARRIWKLPAMRRARRIGMYLAVGGEVDCSTILERVISAGREVYLPVLGGPALRFARYRPGDPLISNRFGIGEPDVAAIHMLSGRQLDVVLTPLVAFDGHGNRLGMGGGFYDRSFAFVHWRTAWQRPRLIGLAHEFQRVGNLRVEPWDVPLHSVVTETQVYAF